MIQDKVSTPTLKGVIVPGLIILVILIVLNLFLFKLEFNFYQNIYNNEVAETRSLLNRRFQSALIAVESIRAFFVASKEVTSEEFDLFGSILTKNIGSGSINIPITVEWVDAQNNIRYVYPMNADNAKIVGLDLNRYPNRLIPITKAKATRSPVITEPIMLGQGYPGLLLYSPIFKGDNYLGSALVVIRLANLLAPIAGSSPIYQKDTHIQTGNFIIPFDDDMIFNNNGERIINPQGDLTKDPISQEYSPPKAGVVSKDIVFADKTWQLRFSPTYISAVNKRIEIYVGFSALFWMAAVIFLWLLNRERERLAVEKARTEALITSIGEGLVASNKKGIITFSNKAAEKISGFTAKESAGRSYYEIWRLANDKGTVIPTVERQFYRALTNREVVNISTTDHLYILRKDGTRVPIASTIAPVIVNGIVDGAIVVFRDITKESEVDRMKTEFLSLVSHQLLTPSTAIKWTIEGMLSGDTSLLSEKQMEGIRNINNSNEEMIGLVNSLLNVSRIESGRLVVEPKPTNLGELAGKVAEELKNKIDEKGQLFSIKSEEGLPHIDIDRRLIKEVYKNLLSNAIKYTPTKGSISVTISKVGDDIVSEIKDSGYGILAKDKNKIFDKFYRGENIVTIEKEGSGLGLYLVKQIVEVSGGKIWFESEVNKGTTFWFSLPLAGSNPKAGEVTIS